MELARRLRASQSLLGFTEYTHPAWSTGAHHKLICEHLEAIERRDITRLIITAPPRHTKSELASRRFPAYYLGKRPDEQVISCSYNAELAGAMGRSVRNIVNSWEYAHIFPTRIAGDSRAADRWETKQGGVYIGAGVNGGVTGRGAHLGIIDDPVKNRADAESQKQRESVWDWYTSTFYTRLMPHACIVVVMTRWHDDDLGGRLLQQKGWTLLELPAVTDGKALWPEWYPLPVLEQLREVIGPRDWSALYMQRPQAEEGDYFKREWFRRYDEPPKHLEIYITHDDAVSDKGTADFTELAVWGIDPAGDIYALDWWRKQALLDESVDALIDLIRKWEPLTVFGETGVIRKAMEPFLRNRMRERRAFANFEWLTRTADKPAMTRGFQARASMGRVHFPMTQWADDVLEQLVRFPSGVHDDAVDACGLLGMALDTIISGSEPTALPEYETDAWGRRTSGGESWRTA